VTSTPRTDGRGCRRTSGSPGSRSRVGWSSARLERSTGRQVRPGGRLSARGRTRVLGLVVTMSSWSAEHQPGSHRTEQRASPDDLWTTGAGSSAAGRAASSPPSFRPFRRRGLKAAPGSAVGAASVRHGLKAAPGSAGGAASGRHGLKTMPGPRPLASRGASTRALGTGSFVKFGTRPSTRDTPARASRVTTSWSRPSKIHSSSTRLACWLASTSRCSATRSRAPDLLWGWPEPVERVLSLSKDRCG